MRALVGYVDQAMGAEGMASLEAMTGVGTEALGVDFDGNWVDYDLMERVAQAAATICGEPDIGRRAGEFSFHMGAVDIQPILRAEGSPLAALRSAVGMSNRSRTAKGYQIDELGPNGVVVRSGNRTVTRFGCAMSLGFWSGVPSLFGAVGYASEPRCRTRGDDECEFRITWTGGTASQEGSIDASRRRTENLIGRFEEMHKMAAELAKMATVEQLLHKVAERASLAVTSPSAVVMVRMADDEPMSYGWSGLDESEAHETALSFADGLRREDDRSVVTAEIRTHRRSYGHLMVFNDPSTRFNEMDQRMLDAYASFASAAIESAASLATARVQSDRSEALLGLARTLADVGSTAEIAQRIAEAVPSLVTCDRSGVALWHSDEREVEMVGSWPQPVEEIGLGRIAVDLLPGASELVRCLEPMLVDVDDVAPSDVAILRSLGIARVALAPIVVRGELRGIVSAVLEEGVDATESLHRLAGLADHAAAALDNSALLDEVRHQSLHDPLTGLPNRTLAEDRVRHALDVAERTDRWVTLLFVDLDDFKAVNDRLGHAAGDDLLREASSRLRRCVRASDTVCRLGGDEFLVLLESTGGDKDGARVAESIISALREPFVVSGEIARVSASVGITSAPGRGTDYDDLLAQADEAMYEVKRKGRDGWAVFAG